MKISKHLIWPALLIVLTACDHTTQLTSGADYLSRIPKSHTHGSSLSGSSLSGSSLGATGSKTVEADIRRIAAVEPDLHFPARIGLARIEGGSLTNPPQAELESFAHLAETLGPAYGEFVPVSPFIASMVNKTDKYGRSVDGVVNDIRRASARQHLDYVLTYEVTSTVSSRSNALSLADLTVLGLYVLPSRNVKVKATASAILIDVRNGYPYGTATAFATGKKLMTKAGSGAARRKLYHSNSLEAVENLTVDLEAMLKELWAKQAKLEQKANLEQQAKR